MKKTTKFLLALAAAAVMSIGAVSTVMAADYPVVDADSWEEDDNGWKAKDVNGTELKSGWAVSTASHYFYFEDGYALTDEFVKWRGDYYYFDEDGVMASDKWVKFTSKNPDAIEELDPYVSTQVQNVLGLDSDATTAYSKEVWCFFKADGTAAKDEWVERDGLWYFFDDVIMVCNDYDYKIDEDGKEVTYGFSGDGNMHVGWVPVNSSEASGKGGPTEKTKSGVVGYVYYESNGKMIGEGWEKIDGDWYYFVKNTSSSKFNNSKVKYGVEKDSTVMLSDMYIKIGKETFWLTNTGAMATGTVTIPKDYKYYTDVEAFLAGTQTNAKATTLVFGDNGAQKLGGDLKKDSNYYLTAGDNTIYGIADGTYNKNSNIISFTKKVATVNTTDVSTGSAISAAVAGDKVKNVFRVITTYHEDSNGNVTKITTDVYYYDTNGNMVKNDVVDFYGLTLAFDKDGKLIQQPEDKVKVGGTYYYFDEEFGIATIGNVDTEDTNNKTQYVTAYGCATKKPASAE